MAEKKPVKKRSRKSAKSASAASKPSERFTDDERAAMRDRAKELKAARSGSGKESDERAVLEKIAAMPTPDRVIAERIHAIVRDCAPGLSPKLWYGMPAYANDGAVVCFFQGAQKFKTRYATLGFSDKAKLDDDRMWPTSFALIELTPAEEAKISALVKKAAS